MGGSYRAPGMRTSTSVAITIDNPAMEVKFFLSIQCVINVYNGPGDAVKVNSRTRSIVETGTGNALQVMAPPSSLSDFKYLKVVTLCFC